MTHVRTDPSPGQRRPRDPQGTRERLVRAALELFTTQGYHHSTTPLIAKRAGVAEGTIYRHFNSKEQLFNEIFRAGVRVLIKSAHDTGPSSSCRERLLAVASAWQEVAVHEPALIKLIFDTDTAGLLDHRSRHDLRTMRTTLEEIIAFGKARNEVKAGSVSVWTDAWLSLVELVLKRTANRDWRGQHQGPRQVIGSAWDAIRSPTDAGVAGP